MELKDKNKIDALNEERDKLINEVRVKQDQIAEISHKIRKINLEHYQHEFKARGLEKGAIFIGFTKAYDYHCDMIKVIKVVRELPLQCTIATYRADDSHFSFNVIKQSITLSSFAEFCNDNVVYRLDHSDYILLLEQLTELTIDFQNIDDVIELIDSWDSSEKITQIK